MLSKYGILYRITRRSSVFPVFKIIISHPMETGYRRDKRSGKIIPAEYIQKLTVSIDGLECIDMELTENISKNPFFSFDLLSPPVEGQLVRVILEDNFGVNISYDDNVHFDQSNHYSFKARQTT